MRAHYSGEVTFLDKWFGYFLHKLYELNLDENTVIAFISDHGHQLGEHNLTGKVTWGMYPELMDIPFLIKHPEGIGAGEEVDEYVYNFELFTTLVKMANIRTDYRSEGIDVWKYVEEKNVDHQREYVTSAFLNSIFYRDNDHWFISNRDGSQAQLYELKSDPKLERNVAEQAPELTKSIYQKILSDAGGSLPEIKTPPLEVYEWYFRLYL